MRFQLIVVVFLFLILGCAKNTPDPVQPPPPTLPTVVTNGVSAISTFTAAGGGEVTRDGGDRVTARGICWGTTTGPTIAGNRTTDSSGIGLFVSAITNLNPGTLYYVRAYATNSVGTAYGNEISFTAALPNIYTAGFESNAASMSVAKYWKNGAEFPLTAGTSATQGWARGMHVEGADIYVVGYEFNGFVYTAKLWKNGLANSLSNGSRDAQALAISVSGTDVYVGGYEVNAAGKSVAVIWKNGNATALTNGANNAQVNGLFISQSDVYAVGYEIISGGSIAKLWKNGVATTLPGSGNGNSANSVIVSGGNVYVSGNEFTFAGLSKAMVWTNGVPAYLTDGFSSIAIAYGMYINGSDIYVAGFDLHSGLGTSKAMLWKNGTGTVLSNPGGVARAHSVFVFNNDVYVTGYEQGSSRWIGKTWKNGTEIYATTGTYNAAGYAVFVK